jgi:hypothetical protein
MSKKTNIPTPSAPEKHPQPKDALPGYPIYPPSEDIYNTDMEDKTIDPEDISRHVDPTEYDHAGTRNEKDFKEDPYGDDLDIPGSELDDDDEIIGNEDEENNYYSLGGDNHNDLEEDQGE